MSISPQPQVKRYRLGSGTTEVVEPTVLIRALVDGVEAARVLGEGGPVDPGHEQGPDHALLGDRLGGGHDLVSEAMSPRSLLTKQWMRWRSPPGRGRPARMPSAA